VVRRLLVLMTPGCDGVGLEFARNARIAHVWPDAPAFRAGMQRGMRVLAVCGTRITEGEDFWTVLRHVGNPSQFFVNVIDDPGESSDEDVPPHESPLRRPGVVTGEADSETESGADTTTTSSTEENSDVGHEGEF